MPVRLACDFYLNDQGYMLARGEYRGRAWARTGLPDSPSRRSEDDARWGNLPDERDHPEVWDDWSGGYGHAYRDPAHPDTYHWAENFDARFPKQLIHAQNMRMLASTAVSLNGARVYPAQNIGGDSGVEASFCYGANGVFESWSMGSPYVTSQANPPHLRSVWVTGRGHWSELIPQDPTLSQYDFNRYVWWVTGTTAGFYAGSPDTQYGHRAHTSASYIYMPCVDGTVFFGISRAGVPNSGDGLSAHHFAVTGAQAWRSHAIPVGSLNRAVYLSNADVLSNLTLTTSYAGTYHIDDASHPILDMVGKSGGQIAVSTARGLYVGDNTATFVNVLAEAGMQSHPENGRDLALWQGAVVYPHVDGLWCYRDEGDRATVEELGPVGKLSDRSPLQGRIRATRGHGQWLLAGLYTGSESYLLAGRRDDADGMIWHPLNRFPHRSKVTRLYVDGAIYASNRAVLSPRLWALTDASIDTGGTAPIYWSPIPPGFGNPLGESLAFSANYVGSARMELGRTDWGAPATPKVYRALEVWADNLASLTQWCQVYYQIDEGPRTALGMVGVSPKDTLYFPSAAVATTTNLCPNPSFEATLGGWTEVDTADTFTPYRVEDRNAARFGGAFVNLAQTAGGEDDYIYARITGLATATYVVSAYCHVTNFVQGAASNLGLSALDAGDGTTARSTTITGNNGVWTRHEVVVALAAGDNRTLEVRLAAPLATCLWDGVQVERALAVTDYCDGDQPGCYWNGAAHTSSSTRETGFATGQSIALSLQSFTTSGGVTPVYRAVVLRGTLRPKSVDEIQAVTRIADGLVDRQGANLRPGAVMLEELRTLAEQASPVQLVDLAGATSWVVVQAPVEEQEIYQAGADEPEVLATVRLSVLDFAG